MNHKIKYTCPKCGAVTYKSYKIRTSGSLLSGIMNIQNRKFEAIVCTNCFYTEFYYLSRQNRMEM
jgi:predicted nucleic-acid-binding Zn-ribbon protein